MTLRAFLADKLGCDPMRITKKYTGASCLGKRVYHADSCKASSEVLNQVRLELEELEAKFKEKLEQKTRERREHELSAVEFQSHVISTPAIDAMMMQNPPWGYMPSSAIPVQVPISYLAAAYAANNRQQRSQYECYPAYVPGVDVPLEYATHNGFKPPHYFHPGMHDPFFAMHAQNRGYPLSTHSGASGYNGGVMAVPTSSDSNEHKELESNNQRSSLVGDAPGSGQSKRSRSNDDSLNGEGKVSRKKKGGRQDATVGSLKEGGGSGSSQCQKDDVEMDRMSNTTAESEEGDVCDFEPGTRDSRRRQTGNSDSDGMLSMNSSDIAREVKLCGQYGGGVGGELLRVDDSDAASSLLGFFSQLHRIDSQKELVDFVQTVADKAVRGTNSPSPSSSSGGPSTSMTAYPVHAPFPFSYGGGSAAAASSSSSQSQQVPSLPQQHFVMMLPSALANGPPSEASLPASYAHSVSSLYS